MERYSVYRPGEPGDFGDFGVIDVNLGRAKPVALCRDGEMAQKIVDLLNAEPIIEELVAEIDKLENELSDARADAFSK